MLFTAIHELGHILVGILLKFKPEQLEITPYGVSVSFDVKCDDINKKIKKGNALTIKKLIVASAGPITNAIIAIIFSTFQINLFGIEREIIVYSNILIGLFNLIPIYPLDGGRIIKNILHMVVGLKDSYKYTNNISKITVCLLTAICSIIILYVKNISILIILVYLWYLVINEDKKYNKKIKYYKYF